MMNQDKSWVWLILLPLVVLGYLLVTIAKASTKSVFDETEDG